MILSIESSCDDSALALTRISDCRLLWQGKISQESAHKVYGGVVPELASRLFARDLPMLLAECREFMESMDSVSNSNILDSKDSINDTFSNAFKKIKAIAVTYEPGLSTSLLEGVMMAKALAIALNVPLIPINHLKGHIFSLFIKCVDSTHSMSQEPQMPLNALLVSGGHSMIIRAFSYENMQIVANSLDDSFGECYDKAAKMLSLGYPGGAIIDKMACFASEMMQSSRADSIKSELIECVEKTKMPIPLNNQKVMNFSFSGLKNAFRLKLNENDELVNLILLANKIQGEIKEIESKNLESITKKIKNNPYALALAYNLQEAATTHIYQKCKFYLQHKDNKKIKNFAIVGGASANSKLRKKMQNLCSEFDKNLLLTKLEFCSDNAAMIGRAAISLIKENPKLLNSKNIESSILNLDINPRNTEILIKNSHYKSK